ncbi:MAG: type I-MYXAN CRISPR-associated Cas8a1/Cmx1 [Gemmataceae bacterium]|nr:type I-MYXAN CRISPR-associated Cas8a1/Cmx1 [Gemmataceae bacterium]
MAEAEKVKVSKQSAPDRLVMRLFAPGMTILHRAGLGGLACTLRAMERQYRVGRLTDDQLPAPVSNDQFPWTIEPQQVTLYFDQPENAREYLRKLFEFAFQIREPEQLIYLPGQYEHEPPAAVLADLQAGLLLTFLQHGRVRQVAKSETTISYDPEGQEGVGIPVSYRPCTSYRHQTGWEEFVDPQGRLVQKELQIDGPLSPGTVVRHGAYAADTAATDPPERMLPLYFAMVGCLALPVNQGVAALLVPEVEDLREFMIERPVMTPTRAVDCRIANAADGALQAQIRLRSRRELQGRSIPGIYTMTFSPTAWASQQKSRVTTIYVRSDERILVRFERALAHLPTRVAVRTVRESTGRGRSRVVTERQEAFRAVSIVRPLVAENLARDRPWYAGFVNLMIKINPANGRPYREQIPLEKGGLYAMVNDSQMWDSRGERLMVQAVHEAIRRSLGRIKDETDGPGVPPSAATRNRWERFREKLRLELAGAKTEEQARFALTDLFSRAGNNEVLRQHWEAVLEVMRRDWRLARDLGLLALASYQGRGEEESSDLLPQYQSVSSE